MVTQPDYEFDDTVRQAALYASLTCTVRQAAPYASLTCTVRLAAP
ncbi:MAG: hypothetical protein P8178_04865 [Candidatus Thiodiazotropha sp.]